MDTSPRDQGATPSPNVLDGLPPRNELNVEERRPLLTGVGRGLARLCPNCGNGRLFEGYLRVQPVCNYCSADNDRSSRR